MPCDVVNGEASPYQVQLVTEIARERLMHAIIERRITLRLVYFEGTKRCEGARSSFSGALIVGMLLAPTYCASARAVLLHRPREEVPGAER